jgi:hypothetical protein
LDHPAEQKIRSRIGATIPAITATVSRSATLFVSHTDHGAHDMHVQIIHQQADGARTDYGIQELDYMPPVGEPFPVDKQVYYRAKAYFGPDENGMYLLVLEGEPKLLS